VVLVLVVQPAVQTHHPALQEVVLLDPALQDVVLVDPAAQEVVAVAPTSVLPCGSVCLCNH